MKKIALIYWPKKGNTEKAALKIAGKFDENTMDVFAITAVEMKKLAAYDALIIGGSTTGADNWEQAHKTRWADFFKGLESAGIKGKPYAMFGLGDQVLYPNHFVDGMAEIKSHLDKCGAKLVGLWPAKGYEFKESKALVNGKFLGLALDMEQQKEMTDQRIDQWVAQIRKELGI